MKEVKFNELVSTDLYIDTIYKGGINKNAGDDPISSLLGVGNQGGFRYKGSINSNVSLCVLYSELSDPDWPDSLDVTSGTFTYFGDNKKPGYELHDTKKKGNLLLADCFAKVHNGYRDKIPPFFVFTKSGFGRDVLFRGLAVPGADGYSQSEDLVAVWRSTNNLRFLNYKSVFTILNEPCITRKWITDLLLGFPFTDNTPKNWANWVKSGRCLPLIAPQTTKFRDKANQLPKTNLEIDLVNFLIQYFKSHDEKEYAFEKCAAEIIRLMDSNVTDIDVTRPWRDGGRDAIGNYQIGLKSTNTNVIFAVEAKCKVFSSGSGVKETSRLISRLSYRQFGIFITTSYISNQAYREILEDQHPVIILSGIDIAKILINSGINSTSKLKDWLSSNF